MNLEPNAGAVDRGIRGGLALGLGVLAFAKARGIWRAVLLALSGALGFTAATGHSPAYAFADFDTLGYRTPTIKQSTCGGGGCGGCNCGAR